MTSRPVVALDIDGTLGDYHAWFTRFAEQWVGRKMPDPADINPALPFHKHLGMSKATYRQCKLAYRQGGLKRSMPVYPGAREMIRGYRKAGAAVWLCTTRPYLRLDNIDPDTRHWLRRNGIQYDGLLYGHNKYRELVRDVGADNVVAVLDDLVAMCDQADSLGLAAFLRDQPYNRYTSKYPRVMNFLNDPWRGFVTQAIREWYM
jgi:phosphoglycolate phosphatase-like HAD superfamily hydrolase